MRRFDYLAVGHITNDRLAAGTMPGGTVAFAGLTAKALGCRTAVLTRCGPQVDAAAALPGITVVAVPDTTTTTFENVYGEGGRQQHIYDVAGRIEPQHVPDGWERSSIVHLAPVANEVAPSLAARFSNSLLGLTPQGWLRTWDQRGRVRAREWAAASEVLPMAAAVVLSREDLPHPALLEEFRRLARLVVVTNGAEGCTVYLGAEERHFPAEAQRERDTTGAGDIFAAAFFVRLLLTRGNPWEAAVYANRIASQTVSQRGLAAKMASLQQAAVDN